jgi:hypothetical protein
MLQRAARASAGMILAFGLLAGYSQPAAAIGVGDIAPDFTLLDLNGTSHSLSQYRGQVVLLGLIGYS